MHLQKARTLRLKLASASDGFGGVSYPAWGGGDGCTEEQNVAFQEAASALESALEQSGKEGMQDLKSIRAILIEYAALHALRILPDKVCPQQPFTHQAPFPISFLSHDADFAYAFSSF
jgi:hypothetical protein